MRSRLSAPTALLYLLSTLLLLSTAARAADDTYDDDDEYEERARVLRVSLLKGEVSLKRAGNDEWEDARLNAPLVEGDVLATGRDSRLEIQADARNFIRVGPDSLLRVVTLRDEGIALSLSEGTATFRLAQFDKDKGYFELDAPGTTVAAERTGQYRVDVERDGAVRVTVREDGRARIYSQNSGFVLRNNRTARLAPDGSGEADWDFTEAAGFDEWDTWNDERERYLASRLQFEGRERYYDSEVYGAEELDAYGDWVYTKDYGYIWRPHTTVINVYNDWAPYRYGRWVWCQPYGWTWVADEPWGWAPYHYGRWVYVDNYWCWAPRGYGYRYRHAWWRPALVAFVTLDFGRDRHVCWYPLTYGQRDPRGRYWSRGYDRLSPLRGRDLEHLRRSNPAWLRAVSTVPAREFGDRALRARPAAGDLAGRALTSEPVRGQLPIARADSMRGTPRVGAGAGGARPTGANGRDTLSINRPTPIMPPRAISDRPTGAAARTPGVSLEGELRRTRVFNNREPRMPSSPDATGGNSPSSGSGSGSIGVDSRGTGAVERPRSYGTPNTNPGGDSAHPARVRPTRPNVPIEPSPGGYPTGDDVVSPKRRERDTGGGDNGAPRVRPTRPSTDQPPSEAPRETRPPDDSSSPVYRPRHEPRIRPRDDEGTPPSAPSAPSRREEPSPTREAPEPRHESPRSEPRHEEPRQEPPRQEAPRQEAPRQEAPRHEAPRQEAPRHRDPEAPRPRERPDNR
ncbi:MAG: hypothetical protein QOH49_2088 [Acidobacteriota bacterium]|jgi:hypothetical protein|nr:hypothetical protein [Acidobacteriota bacterium]